MACDAEHPEMPGVRCRVSDDAPRHAYHQCPPHYWPNVEAQRAEERRRTAPEADDRRRLMEMARRVDANHAFLRRHPHDTEVAAARAVLPRTGTQRRVVYDHVVAAGQDGATDEEMQASLGLHHNSQTPRRLELVQSGLIEDSGRRRTGSSTVPAIVWVATPLG